MEEFSLVRRKQEAGQAPKYVKRRALKPKGQQVQKSSGAHGSTAGPKEGRARPDSGGCAPVWLPAPSNGLAVHIASDCTGLNTTRIALEILGLPAVDAFASDIDPKVRLMLAHNFKDIGQTFGCVLARDDTTLPKDLDLLHGRASVPAFQLRGTG